MSLSSVSPLTDRYRIGFMAAAFDVVALNPFDWRMACSSRLGGACAQPLSTIAGATRPVPRERTPDAHRPLRPRPARRLLFRAAAGEARARRLSPLAGGLRERLGPALGD